MDRIDTIRIDENLRTIVNRMNSLQSSVEEVSDSIKTIHSSFSAHAMQNQGTGTDATEPKPLCCPKVKAGITSADKDKDLLRRLRRGNLFQFDEPNEEDSDPIRKARLLDKFKFEVRYFEYQSPSGSTSFSLPDSCSHTYKVPSCKEHFPCSASAYHPRQPRMALTRMNFYARHMADRLRNAETV